MPGLAWLHCCELCENGWTDRDAVQVVDSGGPKEVFVMAAIWNRAGHYVLVLWFLSSSFFFALLLSFFFFFIPRLISAVADWMPTILPHMVWPQCEFRMQVWNVLHAVRWKYRMQKVAKKLPSGHHRTNLSGSIFATKACIDNRK